MCVRVRVLVRVRSAPAAPSLASRTDQAVRRRRTLTTVPQITRATPGSRMANGASGTTGDGALGAQDGWLFCGVPTGTDETFTALDAEPFTGTTFFASTDDPRMASV